MTILKTIVAFLSLLGQNGPWFVVSGVVGGFLLFYGIYKFWDEAPTRATLAIIAALGFFVLAYWIHSDHHPSSVFSPAQGEMR
jgi:hypothetical protein